MPLILGQESFAGNCSAERNKHVRLHSELGLLCITAMPLARTRGALSSVAVQTIAAPCCLAFECSSVEHHCYRVDSNVTSDCLTASIETWLQRMPLAEV